MTAKRPPKEKPGVVPGDKALREKDRAPAKETAGASAPTVAAGAMTAKRPPKEKPGVAAGNKIVREKDQAPSKETAGAGAPPVAAGAMTVKRLPKEKPGVAPGDRTACEKGRVPAEETAGVGTVRKDRREKSLPASKKGRAGKGAPRLPASAPAAATTGPAPKTSSRRGDPRVSARRHARLAIETLAAVMADPAAAPTMRISAATTLLQWAYGKPTAEGEGAGGKTEQVIRLAWATAGKP